MNEIIKKYRTVIDYLLLTVGAAIMALGIGIFLVEAKVVPGGVSGLSITIFYMTEGAVPVGIAMWVFNVPLFLWGIKELGKGFAVRTFFAFTLNSLFIDLFRGEFPGINLFKIQETDTIQYLLKHDFFFFILLGSVLLGVGLGIIFKFKGTTAGSDIVAAIMQKRYGIKPGTGIMITDFFVISLAGIVIGVKGLSPEIPALVLTIYAFLSLFLSSKLIDFIIDGFDYARVAYIISNKNQEIAEDIISKMNRGATAFKTRGVYNNVEREVIMTVVGIKEQNRLMDIIKSIDKEAFVIFHNAHEILGKGFHRRF